MIVEVIIVSLYIVSLWQTIEEASAWTGQRGSASSRPMSLKGVGSVCVVTAWELSVSLLAPFKRYEMQATCALKQPKSKWYSVMRQESRPRNSSFLQAQPTKSLEPKSDSLQSLVAYVLINNFTISPDHITAKFACVSWDWKRGHCDTEMGKFEDTPTGWMVGKGRLKTQLPLRRQACTTLFTNTSVIYGHMVVQMEENRRKRVAIGNVPSVLIVSEEEPFTQLGCSSVLTWILSNTRDLGEFPSYDNKLV